MLTVKEFITELQNLTNLKITQVNIAGALGTTKSNISLRIKNNSKITLEEMKKIVVYLNLPGTHNVLNKILEKQGRLASDYLGENSMPVCNDILDIDYYPTVFGSCGSGSFVFSEEKEKLQVPCRLVQNYSKFKKYSIINATGDSMSPYILDRDKLIIEHYSGGQISDNRIYIFRFLDNIFVKRLVLNLDQIIVISDNNKYPTRTIDHDNFDNLQIIGRIVGILREEF